MKATFAIGAALLLAVGASAGIIDGQNIHTDATADGKTLLGVQDTPTSFGDSTAGTQWSPFGSELDVMYGSLDATNLGLSIAGNLEANFNKMFIFIDAVAGGENVLLSDNVDGGFNEIQNMAGMTFDAGFEPDHGIRIEIGDGWYGLNFFDLMDNTAGSIWGSGDGPNGLPTGPNTGGYGVTFGWDNSNAAGVTDVAVGDPFTATTGWEFNIPLLDAFGPDTLDQICVSVMINNGGGDFLSNQVLPGIGGGSHLGAPGAVDFNNIPGLQYACVPEPATLLGLVLAGLVARRR